MTSPSASSAAPTRAPLLVVPVRGATARRRPAASGSSPWPASAALALVATTSLGLLAVLVGWYGVSGEGTLRDQLPWLDLAVSGAVLAGLGNCGWLLVGRRAVGATRRALLVGETPVEAAPAAARPRATVPAGWVQAPGMRRVHRPHCALVTGKTLLAVAPDAGPPCAVCSGADA